MPKVKESRANKDYPAQGIKKGDRYYSWSFFRGPLIRSKTRPKQSQLTQTKMSGAYAAMEGLENAIASASCPEDIVSAIDDAVSALNEVVSEYEDSISNLEEVFTGGSPTIDEHNEKKDGIESLVSELESTASEIAGLDVSEYKDDEEQREKKKPDVNDFDDLGTLGQGAMMDAVKEMASQHSIDF